MCIKLVYVHFVRFVIPNSYSQFSQCPDKQIFYPMFQINPERVQYLCVCCHLLYVLRHLYYCANVRHHHSLASWIPRFSNVNSVSFSCVFSFLIILLSEFFHLMSLCVLVFFCCPFFKTAP